MKKFIIPTILALLTLCPALHAEEGKKKGFNSEERLKRMTEHLSLTADQQEKIKAIWEKNTELKELWSKGRDNWSDADKTKAEGLMKSQREEVDAVLTPEQRQKAQEMRNKRREGKPEAK